MLQGAGYEVLLADGPLRALEIIENILPFILSYRTSQCLK
jgi:hypothetical protein